MKIFSWRPNKLYGTHSNTKPSPVPGNYHREERFKEEFSDWPHALLAIGTFGTNKSIERSNLSQENEPSLHDKNIERSNLSQENEPSLQDHHLQDLTAVEVGRLQDELEAAAEAEQEDESEAHCCDDLQLHSTSMVASKGKDVCLEGKKTVIGKKSLSFLLKKAFVCASGFAAAPTPTPREHHLPQSRMEKILRAMFDKKIYPQAQGGSPKVGGKKYLEGKDRMRRRAHGDEGIKWVKTDSEYIVLEI